MDKWQELTIEVNREVEEAASNILIESGSQGVAIDDSADYLENADRFGELYPEVEQVETVKITAYYPESADIEAITKQVNERLAELTDFGLETGDIHLATQELVEEDWAENWKKYYEPARITHDLTIVPSWTDYEASVGEKIIKLDPGMAFGTGTHPTTKMSLFALEQVLRGGETVIDVGTGSGVLSIASSLLGAKEIYAYDLDDVAVRVAQENIDMNPGMENIHVAAGDLLKGVTQEAVSVNTVDGFQGQERDVILISLVRSNENGQIGFLHDLRRMNVAITRARMKLILVGNSHTLCRTPFYKLLYGYIKSLDAQ